MQVKVFSLKGKKMASGKIQASGIKSNVSIITANSLGDISFKMPDHKKNHTERNTDHMVD